MISLNLPDVFHPTNKWIANFSYFFSLSGTDVMWALNLTLLEDGHSDVYDPTVNPSIANHFSAAVFRFAHTLLPVTLDYQ